MRTTPRKNLLQKIDDLLSRAGLAERIRPGDLTAVKIHFGEEGNTSFIRPIFARRVVEAIKALGAKPFLTDTNTLYVGKRSEAVDHLTLAVSHGFDYAVAGAPLIIADGLRGQNFVEREVDGKHYKKTAIASEFANADSTVVLSHFKGHELSGIGGAVKNLGMGAAARHGKLSMHSNIAPKIKAKGCVGCSVCYKFCAHGAIAVENGKALINPEKCAGCGQCIIVCPAKTIQIQWTEGPSTMQEKMAEYARGALAGKEDRSVFLNFLTQISPACDCMPNADSPVVADIGILSSADPVAIDQASADLVNSRHGLVNSALKSGHSPGEDKFLGVHPNADWTVQLAHAERMGAGQRAYTLVEID
jgi:uncharacterized Fe-S center protein